MVTSDRITTSDGQSLVVEVRSRSRCCRSEAMRSKPYGSRERSVLDTQNSQLTVTADPMDASLLVIHNTALVADQDRNHVVVLKQFLEPIGRDRGPPVFVDGTKVFHQNDGTARVADMLLQIGDEKVASKRRIMRDSIGVRLAMPNVAGEDVCVYKMDVTPIPRIVVHPAAACAVGFQGMTPVSNEIGETPYQVKSGEASHDDEQGSGD